MLTHSVKVYLHSVISVDFVTTYKKENTAKKLHACFQLYIYLIIIILPFLKHLLMGDEITTAETLLTVRCLHTCHTSTRAPESESEEG